ncbi:unnamed protein product [Brachionus calyciflorus]|uniref:Elongation of very long chain fatty acids protein n=1 Tax=Brachionus calyciflorus TaxID=104777 RepID=A0A814D1C6_9BILA|nr:unnamed protein product [Brachionus calyciflorus]
MENEGTFDRDKFHQFINEYNYSFMFEFERKYLSYDYVVPRRKWMTENWYLSIVYSIVYILLVFMGQKLMEKREKFNLNRTLVAWNLVLASFSFIGSIRFLPHFIFVLTHKGIEESICVQDFAQGVPGCWSWLFVLSKVAELIDTLFIVLRKQKLIFLHWYHHATVLIYCWFATKDFSSSGRWFVLMNYIVHTFMYSYYVFRALRFKIPKWISIAITSGQISQMIVGLYVNAVAYTKKNRGEKCNVTYNNIYWSFFMYFTYFLLFFNFFMNAYLKKQSTLKTDKKVHIKKE